MDAIREIILSLNSLFGISFVVTWNLSPPRPPSVAARPLNSLFGISFVVTILFEEWRGQIEVDYLSIPFLGFLLL